MGRLKLLIIALAAIVATLFSQATVAFYSADGIATNVVTTGLVDARIVEKHGEQGFPEKGVYIMPGSVVSKKVWVENCGDQPFYLRIKLVNGVSNQALSADMFEIEVNNIDWTYHTDGYYYYNTVVQPGEATEKLFEQVKIAGKMDNPYIGEELTLAITAHAVQVVNNVAEKPWLASGWPADTVTGIGNGGAVNE